MTYPKSGKPMPGRRVLLEQGAGGEPGAHANPRNLIGFLDAFKAVPPFPTPRPAQTLRH
jgi:hypothetical protein